METKVIITLCLILLVSICAVMVSIACANYTTGYLEGQIDYANGNIKVELQKDEANATVWAATQPARSLFWSRYRIVSKVK